MFITPAPVPAIVLNVDDTEANRYWRTRVLTRAGIEVREAASAAEAMALVGEVRPAVVLLDVNLPDGKGLDVCRRIKAAPGPTPLVLLVSAHSIDSGARIEGLDAGADGYLVMPADAGELLAQVRAMLRLHRAEERARQRDALFRALADNIAPLAWMTEPDGAAFWCSPRWREYTGSSLEQLQGWGWASCVHPDHAERVVEGFRRQLRSGEPWEDTFPLRRNDGDYRWFLTRAMPVRDGDGAVATWCATATDITDRKRAEEALAEARRRLDSALIAGEVGTFEWNVTDDRLFGDQNFAGIFNVRLDADGAAPLAAYLAAIHPDDRHDVLARLERTLETGGDYEATYRIVTGEATRWVIARGKAEPDDAGHVTRFPGVVLDVTERMRAEAALHETEGRYRMLFESIEHGFCLVEVLLDAEGRPADYRFIEANPAFERATGLRDAIGRTALEAVPGLERWWVETYGNVALTGEPARFENYAAALERWFDVYAFRFGEPEQRIVAIFFKNITEKKRAEAEREQMIAENARLFEEAQQANKLKDEFLATLSHELRTPLNAMLGWTAVLQTGRLDPGAQRRALDTIERNARAQAQLIADILDISSIAAGKLTLRKQDVQVGALIHQVIETVRPGAQGKHLLIEFDGDAAGAIVRADPSRLQQVLWNLLSNAVKFTGPAGRIEVRAAATPDEVRIVVEDDGIGIAPEFVPYVFNRFRQADGSTTRAYTGMGLGLAIAKDLVQMHGGGIDVESPGRDRGATFTVRLPRAHAEQREPEDDAAPSEIPSGLVLVVDDHQDTRDMMELMLGGRGVRVVTAASTADAVTAFRRTPCDIALIDISMPGEDGYTCLRRLRETARQLDRSFAAIALTAHARQEERADILDAGFAAHVSKPVDLESLLAAIQQAGDGPPHQPDRSRHAAPR